MIVAPPAGFVFASAVLGPKQYKPERLNPAFTFYAVVFSRFAALAVAFVVSPDAVSAPVAG